ncbi:MAG: DUF5063 domain-containing protein [Bacteroidales bacterium]|nr:DUF5063 domain-containing protein [Bacteroidales bacterium]
MSTEKESEDKIYSTEVIDFIKISNDFCKLVENSFSMKRSGLLKELQLLLPLLYIRSMKLPVVESVLEDGNEKFVTEEQYEGLKSGLALKLGYLDDYPEVIDPGAMYDSPVTCSLSEDLADIFQELKDFLTLFQIGTNEMMNDAIWETRMNFDNYWGQKLLNGLRMIHKDLNAEEPVNDEETIPDSPREEEQRDTSSWFVTKRQNELRDGDL